MVQNRSAKAHCFRAYVGEVAFKDEVVRILRERKRRKLVVCDGWIVPLQSQEDTTALTCHVVLECRGADEPDAV